MRVPPSQCLYGAELFNGIDRVDSTKAYVEDNVVACCKRCNLMKRSYSKEEFLIHVLNVVKHSQTFYTTVSNNTTALTLVVPYDF